MSSVRRKRKIRNFLIYILLTAGDIKNSSSALKAFKFIIKFIYKSITNTTEVHDVIKSLRIQINIPL